jgi:hypothetical protein
MILQNKDVQEIDQYQYLPDKLKAFIKFKNEKTAQFVSEKSILNILQYQFPVKLGNKSINNKTQKLYKSLQNNIFLSLLLAENNLQPRQEFINFMKSDLNTNLIITNKQLIIILNQQISEEDFNSWKKDIEKKITSFCNMFSMEITEFDEMDKINDLIRKTNNNKDLYYEIRFNSKLYIIGRREDMRNFLKNTSIITKSIDLPKLQFNGFNSLISLALKKLQTKYNLQSYQLNVNNFKIDLTAPEKNIDQVIDQLNHTFVSFKNQRIDKLSKSSFLNNSKNLNLIIQDCLKTDVSFNSLIYKIQILQTNDEDSGVFLSYFYNCPDLDSINDKVFTSISQYLMLNLIQIEVDVSNYSAILNDTKWKTFEQENFCKSKCLNKFSFFLNEKNVIYLTGTLKYVYSAKSLIERFLSENKLVDKGFRFNMDDSVSMKN